MQNEKTLGQVLYENWCKGYPERPFTLWYGLGISAQIFWEKLAQRVVDHHVTQETIKEGSVYVGDNSLDGPGGMP